jgi:hypothetical protein
VSASNDNKDSSPKPAGRVRHDSSGRAIWEWAAESGRHAIDSTSALLKRLDLPGLTLADDEKKKQKRERKAREATEREADTKPAIPTFGGPREEDPVARTRRSFNPYDTRVPAKRVEPKVQPKPVARITQPVRKKRGFLARIFGVK